MSKSPITMIRRQWSSLWSFLRSYPTYILLLLGGVAFALLVAWYVQDAQTRRARENFQHLTERDFFLVNHQFLWYEHFLLNLGNFYLSSQYIDCVEFDNFLGDTLERYVDLHAIGWIEYNSASSTDYFMWSHVKPHSVQLAENTPVRKEHFFYDYIQEAIGKRETVLFSHLLDENHSLDLKSLSPDLSDAEDVSLAPHFILMRPVYEENETGEDGALIGIAYNIIHLSELVEELFQEKTGKRFFKLAVVERNLEGQDRVLYSSIDPDTPAPYSYERVITLGGREIVWRFEPTRAFMKEYDTYGAVIIFTFLIILTMTGLLIKQMHAQVRRTARVNKQMQEYTDSLELARMEALEAKHVAEEANRAKSDFLAVISHELRTPMNGVLGMAELIVGTKPAPSQEVSAHARTIMNSGETLLALIDDLLDYSKIEAGKMEFDPVLVNLETLVYDVVNLYLPKANGKSLEIIVHFEKDCVRHVLVDLVRMRQILANLVSNAIKFTERGYVAIHVLENKSKSKIDSGIAALSFSVADSGVGVSEKAQQQIFEKFSQADNSTTREYGGTGLGLAICKNLVEMMGGEISLESAENKGSVFRFDLPVKVDLNFQNEKNREQEPIEAGRLLVVDDQDRALALMRDYLEDGLETLDFARNADSAWNKISDALKQERPYDMVLVDYHLPYTNAIDLVASLREQDEEPRCYILMAPQSVIAATKTKDLNMFAATLSKPLFGPRLVSDLNRVWRHFLKGTYDTPIPLDPLGTDTHTVPEDQINLSHKQILVAEDNLVNQVFMRAILDGVKARYTIVENGEEAVQKVRSGDYDLIIMDCLMPVMDGFEASRQIVQMIRDGVAKNAPILALTANVMEEDREKCLQAGMSDYLSKPVRKPVLIKKIMELLNVDQESAMSGAPPAEVDEMEQDMLDMEMIETARNLLEDKFPAMVDTFFKNCQTQMAEIEAGLEAENPQDIIRPAHSLKSSCRQMGVAQLSSMAALIESMANEMHAKGSTEGLDKIAETLAQIKAALPETEKVYRDKAAGGVE